MKLNESSLSGRIILFVGGLAGSAIINECFDWFIFPLVMSWFGVAELWKSMLILYIAALMLNYVLVRVYDLFKKDLFGFEEIKKIRLGVIDEGKKKKWRYRMLVRLSKHQVLLFIFLSTWDPFLATLYKRESAQFDGFKKKDYMTLLLSTFIGCFFWAIVFSPVLLVNLQSLF